MKFYTGIGSRKTPADILTQMEMLATALATKGYRLRSGGAPGADSAFEKGAGTNKEIYLPWQAFNGNQSPLYMPTAQAVDLAEKFHPAWHRLSFAGRKLMGRNSHQVLGQTLMSPSDFIICWTEGGKGGGGTGQAIRIAKAYNIPVYDLGGEEGRRALTTITSLLAA